MWDDSFKFNAIKQSKCLSLNLFVIGFLNIVKIIQQIKTCTRWAMKVLEDRMGYENLKENLDGAAVTLQKLW